MFLTSNTIETLLLTTLQNGSIQTTKLIFHIQKLRPGTTKQGVYQIIRKLKETEQIVIRHKIISLNTLWLNDLEQFIKNSRRSYSDSSKNSEPFFHLKDGEKIIYTFDTAILADRFWIHTLFLMLDNTAPNTPLFLYDPHCWFLIGNNHRELSLIRHAKNTNHQYLLAVHGQTILDKQLRSLFDGATSQYAIINNPPKHIPTYYINSIGDFVIEVYMGKKVSQEIDEWFSRTKAITPATITELASITNTRGKTRMIISQNKKRAEKLKNRLKHYFVLAKNK